MTSSPFQEFLKLTTPGPPGERCSTCRTISLRTYVEPQTREEKVVCVNVRCAASPLHKGQ